MIQKIGVSHTKAQDADIGHTSILQLNFEQVGARNTENRGSCIQTLYILESEIECYSHHIDPHL